MRGYAMFDFLKRKPFFDQRIKNLCGEVLEETDQRIQSLERTHYCNTVCITSLTDRVHKLEEAFFKKTYLETPAITAASKPKGKGSGRRAKH